MHHCLEITEILKTIFNNFGFSASRRDLYALALVSKAFHEPALDVLWELQDCILPLIKTFPVEVWEQSGNPSTLSFQRPLVATDIVRFRFYGRRMKTLHITDQVFRMYVSEQAPGLATLTIFSALRAKSPHVQDFNIHGGQFSRNVLTPHISISLCGFLRLHTIHCSEVALTHEAIVHLVSLPTLYEVDIYISNGPINITEPHSPFPALRLLTLNGDSITPHIEFVKKFVRSALLQSFSICVANPPSSAELGQMFSLLVAHSAPEHLTSIEVRHPDYIGYGDDSPSLLNARDFEPLTKFTNLECISIETECTVENFDDSFLETLAWTKLHHLAFTNCWSTSPPSQCTLRGILHLALHCPDLTSLSIPFQASAEISWNGRPGGGVVNEHLQELDVGQSPITDPRAVASFLSDIFPRLKCIVAWDNFDPDNPTEVANRKRWMEMIQLFESFVAIRNEERAWAAAAGGRSKLEMRVD
ncbi:hypothetical protein PILCRDRAFT_87278 [Piloderma croceum F 1598]|uniref:F-box domain-containing protein n=1 Tax=Piloderma croceum (strain F 1598) TaxID=765440 RepID=A0A0C3C5I7_PILCF|nr:hypothetical protein PILCRDRAFT_87278 [Piloderma croceum F 1598]